MSLRFLFVSLLILALPARAAEIANPDDTARFLAGMPIASASPLAALADTRAWETHARYLDATFSRVEKTQLSKIRIWSNTYLTVREPTLFYMFSGPDFLYANAFFPDASTYVLSGLEPVGAIPDLTKLPRGALPRVLRSLQVSMRSILNLSFFQTIEMQSELRASPVNGTLPILYVFLARSGKVVRDVRLIQLDEMGNEETDAKPHAGHAQGVKITFMSPGGPEQTLYYFSTNIANGGFAKGGLEAFCDQFDVGDSFIKSASYLLHSNQFSQVRTFLLQKSALILQDDTGIPVAFFGPSWQLTPFGRYLEPISLFRGQYQPRMAYLFRRQPYNPLPFGVGYRYRPKESNLLLAVKSETAARSSR